MENIGKYIKKAVFLLKASCFSQFFFFRVLQYDEILGKIRVVLLFGFCSDLPMEKPTARKRSGRKNLYEEREQQYVQQIISRRRKPNEGCP